MGRSFDLTLRVYRVALLAFGLLGVISLTLSIVARLA